MSIAWLAKVIFAYLLIEFVLQPDTWQRHKAQKHFKSILLHVQAFMSGVAILVLTGFQYWYVAIIIWVSHIIIDGWKSYKTPTVINFLTAQLFHLLVILFCWYISFYSFIDFKTFWKAIRTNEQVWTLITAYVFLSTPAGITIGLMTRKWSRQIQNSAGLTNAGKWIGILERLLIFTFLLISQYGAIGFLITAKGLLRFSEKDKQEEKTEYILIGSLISITVAIFTGLLVKYLLHK